MIDFITGSSLQKNSMVNHLMQKMEPLEESLTERMMIANSSEEVKLLLKFTPNDKYLFHKRLVILEFKGKLF